LSGLADGFFQRRQVDAIGKREVHGRNILQHVDAAQLGVLDLRQPDRLAHGQIAGATAVNRHQDMLVHVATLLYVETSADQVAKPARP